MATTVTSTQISECANKGGMILLLKYLPAEILSHHHLNQVTLSRLSTRLDGLSRLSAPTGTTLPDLLKVLGAPIGLVFIIVLLLAFKQLMDGAAAFGKLIMSPLRILSPSLYTASARADAAARRRIAVLLLQNLELLETDLNWQQNTFVDIRVTVESVDSPSSSRGLRRLPTNFFRTKSLSKALSSNGAPLVLLQGSPGAGKSVAMRHLAITLLREATKERVRSSVLPLYASLRDFDIAANAVDATVLREYIASQVNPGNAGALTDYFEKKFADDLADGNIILFLDSFDEIPGVLGSARINNATVRPYVQSIVALMGGGKSKCVVASRPYRGPQVPGWTRLELIGLSYDEQVRVLGKYGATEAQIQSVEQLLIDPRVGFSADLRNPLYLSLLAQFMGEHGRPPTRPTEMFEGYVNWRLVNSGTDLSEAEMETLKRALAIFAFQLTSSPDKGLSGSQEALLSVIMDLLPTSERAKASRLLSAAGESKLLVDTRPGGQDAKRIAFAHRRVLEYFATRYVIEHGSELSPRELVLNGRWRETAVAMLQVGTPSDVEPLFEEIENVLNAEISSIETSQATDFEWSSTATHLLESLVSAYGADPRRLPESLRAVVSQFIIQGWQQGGIGDRKFALDCMPLVESQPRMEMVERAFSGTSEWLRLGALRDCASLHPLPESLDTAIRRLLITLMGGGRLQEYSHILDADLRRLYNGRLYARIRRVLTYAPFAVLALCVAKIVLDYVDGWEPLDVWTIRRQVLYWLILPLGLFWLFRSSEPIAYAHNSRLRRMFRRIFKRLGWGEMDAENVITLLIIVFILDFVISLGSGVGSIVDGHPVRGITWAIVGPVTAAYALTWGPALVLGIRRRWFSEKMSFWEIAVIQRRTLPGVLAMTKRNIGSWILFVVVGIIFQALFIGVIVGIFYLLSHYAGHVGRISVRILTIGFLSLTPLIVIIAVMREVMSRRRVRGRFHAEVNKSSFLDSLCLFADPLEAAEYIRILRTQRTDDCHNLPRSFIRQLIKVTESVRPDRQYSSYDAAQSVGLAIGVNKMLASHGRNWDSGYLSQLDDVIKTKIVNGQLNASVLSTWQGAVLDELGMLDELLRER